MLGRIPISLILLVAGYFIVWKADWILRNFGAVPSAEKFFRTEGGSRTFYKFIGILFLIVGAMHLSGLLNPFMVWLVRKLFWFN